MSRRTRRLSALLALLLAAMSRRVAAGEPKGTPLSREAIDLCHRARSAPDGEKEDLLARSIERADRAISADDHDALAYFARFCALGEQARASGAGIGSLIKLWPIRDAVDRTLELEPDFPDALLGKGALLLSVPRLLGGDPKEGERLVRRALELDADYLDARLQLARALAEQGRKDEARGEARRALASAEKKQDSASAAEAHRVLADLDR